VGTAFPAGRFLWLLWHPSAWGRAGQELKGLGHYAPYTTHRLIFEGQEEKPPEVTQLTDQEAIQRCGLKKEVEEGLARATCGCSYPVLALAAASAMSGASDAGRSESPSELVEGSGSVEVLKNQTVKMEPLSESWDKRTPFIVASAPGNLINGHNDIYNPNLVLFLIGYINNTLPGPGESKPASGEVITECE
jgi:hypothetical protein